MMAAQSQHLTESSKSPAGVAKSNKLWVGTCLYQEECKLLLINWTMAFNQDLPDIPGGLFSLIFKEKSCIIANDSMGTFFKKEETIFKRKAGQKSGKSYESWNGI